MFFFDPVFLLFMVPALILGFITQQAVQGRFNKYAQVRTMRGLTGAKVAREILDANGLYDVAVEETQGFLSDHYDPRSRVLRLSPEVYRQPSISAVGVAAHEAGHALQHAKGYVPLQARSAMVPAVQIGSSLGPMIIMGGILLEAIFRLSSLGLMIAWIGVGLYALVALFSVITLPVELDASARAKNLLYQYNIVDKRELDGVTSVLNAAAWTYVVAAIAAILQLAYWVFRLMGRRD
ncbi:MAG: zinc metallopeptidase [Anaerolineae bacterium]|nr:zinc metallopeptidase [Anaerolineae bacterium]